MYVYCVLKKILRRCTRNHKYFRRILETHDYIDLKIKMIQACSRVLQSALMTVVKTVLSTVRS